MKHTLGSRMALVAASVFTVALGMPQAAMAHGSRDYDYARSGYYYGDDGNYEDDGYRGYRRSRHDDGRGYRGYRCDKGTGGTIIGAIAGGLLGHEVVGRRGDRTAGVIVGAGVGALAGRAIDRSSGRRC